MRTKFIFILMALVLMFGCISDETYNDIKRETISNKQEHDIDGDGIWDYAVYDFSTVKAGEKTQVHRMLAVAKIQHAEYTSFDTVTDLDLLEADGKLDDFSRDKRQSEDSCTRNTGVFGVKCADIYTCSRLCSANEKCRKMTADYSDVIGSSMIAYGRETSTIDSLVVNTRNIVLELRNAGEERKNIYLSDLMEVKSLVALLNTNPILFHPEVMLCEQGDYGIESVVEAAGMIGDYSEETIGYEYTMVLHIEPDTKNQFSGESIGVEIVDYIPAEVEDSLSSYQKITTSGNGGTSVSWVETGMEDGGYLLYYTFQSDAEPDEVAAGLNVPAVQMRYLDLSFIIPFSAVFMFFYSIFGNYYFAAGFTIGLSIALVIFLYSLIVFLIQMLSYQLGGRKFNEAIKRAFGRIGVRWKIDFPLGIIGIAAGLLISAYLAPGQAVVTSLLDMLEPLMDPFGFAGFALTAIGIVLIYDGFENLLKVTTLERYYGVAVREERSTYLANIAELRKKLKELKEIIENYSQDDFDVGSEYAVLSSISFRQIDNYQKRMTSSSITAVEDNLAKVENAIESLRDRRGVADEKWPIWKEMIGKILSEKNQVNAAMLTSIPSNLRTWALTRYAKDEGEELIFEKDVLKRKRMTANILIKEMVREGFMKGAVVLKDEKVEASYFEGRSASVQIVLLYKLRSYLNSLGKALALGIPSSFVSVGDKNVFVLMKISGYECGLFVEREKFREAIERWKTKMRAISE